MGPQSAAPARCMHNFSSSGSEPLTECSALRHLMPPNACLQKLEYFRVLRLPVLQLRPSALLKLKPEPKLKPKPKQIASD